ncbi:MAG: hypothetical protein ACLVMH_08685 [Christensenellales bacterium]
MSQPYSILYMNILSHIRTKSILATYFTTRPSFFPSHYFALCFLTALLFWRAIMTTGLAGGLTKPCKGILPAALTRIEDPPTAPLSLAAPKGAVFYALFYQL